MHTRWDHLEDVRFVLDQPPKSKQISKFSARQLFSNVRPPSEETQISEYGHERVSVRRLRGRAPTLHLRLSKFDLSPIIGTLRSPPGGNNSLHSYLIPETTPTESTMEIASGGYPRHPFHGNPPSDVPTSPITPNSPWAFSGPTHRTNSSGKRTGSPQSSTGIQGGGLPHLTHMRENTMSSTMSNLQVEVVTLSESPPDPGFVLPIPSRSRITQNRDMPPIDFTQTVVGDVHSYAVYCRADLGRPPLQELQSTNDSQFDRGSHQLVRATSPRHTPPVNGSSPTLPPLEPPRRRQTSWASERSDASSAVISTVTRLTRANTSASMTVIAIRRNPGRISGDRALPRQTLGTVAGSPLSAVHVERPGGDTG